MAKGNDGNLLQHCVEVELAVGLSDGGPLRLFATHGMAPFEPLAGTKSLHGLLDWALERSASGESLEGLSRVLAAYRASDAGRTRYPNSAELLRVALDPRRLSGIVCELDAEKVGAIVARLGHEDWKGASIAVQQGSWRSTVKGARLEAESSWLFTMDPMQFKPNGFADDEFLYRADLALVFEEVKPLLDGPCAGAVVIFSYTMMPDVRAAFEKAVAEVFDGWEVVPVVTRANGGLMHAAAIVTNRPTVAEAASRAWTTLVDGAKK